MTESATEFVYRDRALGDQQDILIHTDTRVFYPTSTSVLLLRAVRKFFTHEPATALDLGCGTGVVAVVLGKYVLPGGKVYASDLSEAAVKLARKNAAVHGVAMECRCGSLFEPWAGMTFDLIVDDVAGVAEPIARASRWYPEDVPSEAGEDGTRWITQVLEQAPGFLAEGGHLFFPIITLSNAQRILATAEKHFARVELLEEQWYPFDQHLLANFEVVQKLADTGLVEIKQRGSRQLWATRIYAASDPN